MLHVKSAKYIDGYRIWISFDDGTEGEADLSNVLTGPAFVPLRDKSLFGRLCVNPELETIVWPNGADLAPEYLKELVTNLSASTRGIA